MSNWLKLNKRTSHFSTTRINAFAWFSWLLGVLQIEVMQNSPHLQFSWLNGQYIFPHACDPPTWIRQFWDSANWIALSIDFLGCFVRFKWVSRVIDSQLVVNRQLINKLHQYSNLWFLTRIEQKKLAIPFKQTESPHLRPIRGTMAFKRHVSQREIYPWTNQPFGGSLQAHLLA